jgi:hypothetical protein|tara:strand:- start:112 stop:417 length:306 start_codon:yes stop_codon:yes gene_type:complete
MIKKTFSVATDNHLQVILANMCRYVEANYLEIDFSNKQWFRDYTWNKEKEVHFKKWLTDYIYGVRVAQKEFYGRTTMRKKECEEAASMFVFNYGWSNKDGE